MRYTITIAALAALAAAGDAPIADGTNIGMTFSANLPSNGNVTGTIVGSGAPNGEGSNFQISLYNLPRGASLSYGITAQKIRGGDCSSGGGLLNPFNGVQGGDCTENNAKQCAIGDLSGKHGDAILQTGGAGTGYFTVNVVDDYLSTDKSNKAFFGNKAVVIMDQNNTPLTCANFVNQSKLSADAAKHNQTEASASAGGMATRTGGSSDSQQASQTASASQSGNAAVRTAVAGVGAAVGVVAAFVL